MPSIFDTLQVAFWSLTYITIIACGIKHREEHKPMMPYIAGGLNRAYCMEERSQAAKRKGGR